MSQNTPSGTIAPSTEGAISDSRSIWLVWNNRETPPKPLIQHQAATMYRVAQVVQKANTTLSAK